MSSLNLKILELKNLCPVPLRKLRTPSKLLNSLHWALSPKPTTSPVETILRSPKT